MSWAGPFAGEKAVNHRSVCERLCSGMPSITGFLIQKVFWVPGTCYFKAPVDTLSLSPVATGTQKDEEGDEEEGAHRCQAPQEDDLRLSLNQQASLGSHGGRGEWHGLLGSVSPSKVATWGQRVVSSCRENSECFDNFSGEVPESGSKFWWGRG